MDLIAPYDSAMPPDDESAEQQRSYARQLNRPHIVVDIVRRLAQGDTQQAIATRYGVSQPAISLFATKHADRIALVRENQEDEFAGIWIADKAARLAAYAADVEAIDSLHAELVENYREAGGADVEGTPLPLPLSAGLLGAKHRAVRNAAEELGALKTVIDTTVQVKYQVVGIDPDDLK